MRARGFVGRAAELSELTRSVGGKERVVVVTGPAGVGKSRLVETWAEEHEVSRADLGAARDLEDALRRIGAALRLRFGPEEDIRGAEARVAQALASRPDTVLFIDDADAVVEVLDAALGRLHRAAPSAVFVVTSRRSVLTVPHRTLALGPLPRDEAVTLLVERARRVRPDFEVSDAQRASVDLLVERVDALPLGLELLAPRLRLLSPAQLLSRLEGTAGPRDALDQALDRSFELLSPWERDALAQCTVSRDGFYLDAAEAFVDLSAHRGAPDVLTVLESLVDQSLLRTTTIPELPDDVRLRFFGAVWERAKRELDPEASRAVAARHARYYADAAERWDEAIESADEVASTARLVVELPNLEAAFERAPDRRTRARLGLALHLAHQRRGPFGRQRELVEEVRSIAQELGDATLSGRAELAAARVYRWGGDLARSAEALARAIEHAVAAGDVVTEASCARNMAANCFRAGDLGAMRAHLERALDAAVRSGRPSDEVNARNGLGWLYAELGEIDAAQRELERALKLARTTGIPGLVALVQSSLASLMLRAERYEPAEHHATEAIRSYEELGYLRQWALEHLVRGEARLLRGDLAGAREDAQASVERARFLGLSAPHARALALRGRVAFFERDFRAAREALDEALARLPANGSDARTARGYLAACAAMSGDETHARDGDYGDDPLAALFDAFVRLGEARASAARGEDVELAPLGDDLPASSEARRLAELWHSLARELLPGRDTSAVRVEVAEDGGWFRVAGADGVDLTRRRALRGVLEALVARRLAAPGRPLSVDDVLEAGWPGERMSPESGARRVYVTINRLRNLGFGELLLTTGDGYMLAPRVDVVVA